ncbi:unnamed protein product [Peniophora sp. CBMAI 1063]|nr:unnamed protein product [Peniophora sp. CBMAI 1063]
MSTPASTSGSSPTPSERVVRFDDRCVLVPEHRCSRLPRFLQGSYSLSPIFHRDSPPNPIDEAANADIIPNVSRPSLLTRLSSKMAHSPSPRRSNSADRIPLSPCLVHHDHDHDCDRPPLSRAGRRRRPSLPEPISHSVSSPGSPGAAELITVPLRPCCVQCFKVTEACLAHGDAWRERFTRAARNRRNASIDFQMARQNRSPPGQSSPGTFAAVTVDEVAKEGIVLSDSPESEIQDAESPRLVVEGEDSWVASVPADVLGAGITRKMLSPIPSRNVSTEDLMVARKPSSLSFERITHEELLKADAIYTSPPASPPPRTPSPPERSVSNSPKHRFKFPAGAELLRAGVDMFKGVGSFSPTSV